MPLNHINDRAEQNSTCKSVQILGKSKLKLVVKCWVDLWREAIYGGMSRIMVLAVEPLALVLGLRKYKHLF